MISNPIIHKEVLSALRTRKAIAMQGLFLLVLAGLMALLWPGSGTQDVGGQQARRLLTVIAMGEIAMVAMFAASFTAAAITLEKERRTWECLFATAMRPWEIALGKMTGSLSFLLLLVLSGVPALASLFLLGGVRGSEILAVVGILFLSALYLGMIGLLVSVFTYRSYRAVIVTYAIVLVISLLFAAPTWPVSGNLMARAGPGLQKIMHVLASLSPLQAMISVVMPGGYAAGAAGMPDYWQLFLPISLVVVILGGIIGLYKLSKAITTSKHRQQTKVVERGKITARSFLFLIDPRKRKRMIQWWQNPILVKEFRTRPMLQAQWLLRAIGICLISSVLLMLLVAGSIAMFVAESSSIFDMMATAVAALMVIVVIMVGPAIASSAICADRETGVWDMLRRTTIPSWRLVSGKFQASLIPLLLIALAMAPALLILLYFNTNLWLNLQRILCVVGMTILFLATVGMFFSAVFSRTSTATGWTYATVGGLCLTSLLAMLAPDLFAQDVIRSVYLINPVAAAMDAAGHAGMQKLDLYFDHLKLIGIATAVLFVVTVARVFQLRRPE
jgi:ABC-type transport system involved in multi-copper enzyme maturation permease subunit